MKFTIDTTVKTVEIDGTVNIKELTEILKKLLGDEWKEYSIKDAVTTRWYGYPTWYYPYVAPAYPVTYVSNGHTAVIANF